MVGTMFLGTIVPNRLVQPVFVGYFGPIDGL